MAERQPPPRYRSGRKTVPCRFRDQPRYPGADYFLRAGCPDGGFRFSPRSPGPSADRFRPVDVSLPPVCGGSLCPDKGRSGSDPAQLLWLRSGRCHHRSGQRHSLRLRQDLYLFKDRRSQQPRCGKNPCPLPAFCNPCPRKEASGTQDHADQLKPRHLYRRNAQRLHDPLSADVPDPFRSAGTRFPVLRL